MTGRSGDRGEANVTAVEGADCGTDPHANRQRTVEDARITERIRKFSFVEHAANTQRERVGLIVTYCIILVLIR